MLCARVIRGMSSKAKAVTLALPSLPINSGCVSGERSEMSTTPSGSVSISSSVGAWTFKTTLAPRTAALTSRAIVAPTSRYSASEKWDGRPAPDTTVTSHPSFSSLGTLAGINATRCSPGSVSPRTATSMKCSQLDFLTRNRSNHPA